jgi:hypothetical protein
VNYYHYAPISAVGFLCVNTMHEMPFITLAHMCVFVITNAIYNNNQSDRATAGVSSDGPHSTDTLKGISV